MKEQPGVAAHKSFYLWLVCLPGVVFPFLPRLPFAIT